VPVITEKLLQLMAPLVAFVTQQQFPLGLKNTTVFVRLYASPTNWNLIFSPFKSKVRLMLAFSWKNPGPISKFLPVVPKTPVGGLIKAEPSK
jgi:hypothetical protein